MDADDVDDDAEKGQTPSSYIFRYQMSRESELDDAKPMPSPKRNSHPSVHKPVLDQGFPSLDVSDIAIMTAAVAKPPSETARPGR